MLILNYQVPQRQHGEFGIALALAGPTYLQWC